MKVVPKGVMSTEEGNKAVLNLPVLEPIILPGSVVWDTLHDNSHIARCVQCDVRHTL